MEGIKIPSLFFTDYGFFEFNSQYRSKRYIMKTKKLSLPFVLSGKEFELTDWTVKKHEEVLKEVAELEKKYKKDDKIPSKEETEELDKKYRIILILKGLHEIDPNVKESDLATLHPDDFVTLFSAIYLQGRRGIFVEDDKSFREKSTKSK